MDRIPREAAARTGDRAAHGQGDPTGGVSPPPDPVARLYEGRRAALRPLYEAIVRLARSFGADVEVVPRKHDVSLRRRRQFAQIQATLASRIDVGLHLPGVAPTPRLRPVPGRCTHNVTLAEAREIDAEFKRWLRASYEAS